jgi:hypothetical protein
VEKHQKRELSDEELVAKAYEVISENKRLVAERRRLLERAAKIAARLEDYKLQKK